MALQQFNLKNLGDLDEAIVEAFRRHLARAVADCDDRPADKKPRSVILEFSVSPVFNTNTLSIDSVDVEVAVTSKVPPHRTKPYNMAIKAGGLLAFNNLSPDDVYQKTIDDHDSE